ncbi:MAG: aldo/keto reductase [Chitinophagaceae bacterium]
MIKQPYTTLNNGIQMPLLGLGVYDMYREEAEQAVMDALEIGYRLIDTASMYQNEEQIGNAMNRSAVPRSEIFLTTKLNNSDHGYDQALKAFDISLNKLKQEYVDLYLIHWPIRGKRHESWKALVRLYEEKRVRAIGVANYMIPMLEELKGYSDIVPAVDQVEFSPWLFQKDLLEYCKKKDIQLQSYSPITRGKRFDDERLLSICRKYGKTPAQIVLRWHIQHGISTIPKSSKKERLIENFGALDVTLTEEEMNTLNSCNDGFRICDDPMDYF